MQRGAHGGVQQVQRREEEKGGAGRVRAGAGEGRAGLRADTSRRVLSLLQSEATSSPRRPGPGLAWPCLTTVVPTCTSGVPCACPVPLSASLMPPRPCEQRTYVGASLGGQPPPPATR